MVLPKVLTVGRSHPTRGWELTACPQNILCRGVAALRNNSTPWGGLRAGFEWKSLTQSTFDQ